MNWKLVFSTLALACAFTAAPGCAVDAQDGADEGASEETSTSADELKAHARRLVGAFHHSGGGVLPPTFEGIVFDANGTFFADIDTGIRCITTPCPSHVRLTGTFTATKNFVRLSPRPGEAAESFHARYRYTLAGDSLTLARTGSSSNGWTNTLSRKLSYCAEPTDCGSQGLIHPECVGDWACGSASSARQCAWECTVEPPPPPATDVWPADATQLVAQSSGGGFTPPPPPGSTCPIGQSKFTLDVAAQKLAYELCKSVDWSTPFTKVTGEKVLTAAEMTQVHDAMGDVAVSTRTICGADKPYVSLAVTSASKGTTTYKDSFYSCQGTGPFADGIDGVLQAFHDIVGE